jgi:hypothetical protein
MATKFNKGQVVKVRTVVPNGPVEKIRMAEDGEIYYFISWVDQDNHKQGRWFAEKELMAG